MGQVLYAKSHQNRIEIAWKIACVNGPLGNHNRKKKTLNERSLNSSKLHPFQALKARLVRYHSSEQRYYHTRLAFRGLESTMKLVCTNVHILFVALFCRSFHNLFGQRASIKHKEVLTFHFPCLYGLCSRCQQLKVNRRLHLFTTLPSTAVRLNVI